MKATETPEAEIFRLLATTLVLLGGRDEIAERVHDLPQSPPTDLDVERLRRYNCRLNDQLVGRIVYASFVTDRDDESTDQEPREEDLL